MVESPPVVAGPVLVDEAELPGDVDAAVDPPAPLEPEEVLVSAPVDPAISVSALEDASSQAAGARTKTSRQRNPPKRIVEWVTVVRPFCPQICASVDCVALATIGRQHRRNP